MEAADIGAGTSFPLAATVPSQSSPTPGPTRVPAPSPTNVPKPSPARVATPTATQTQAAEPNPNRPYHVPILVYHRIAPPGAVGGSIPDLVVTPGTFAVQMKALFDAGWHSITLATLASDMQAGRTIPAKTFAITFDDGWADGYVYAFPILRRYGFVATYFVIGGRINHPSFLSAQEMRTLEAAGDEIGNHTVDHIKLSKLSLPKVQQEVENCSVDIARAVGHRPVSFSYPKSDLSAAVILAVSQIPGIEIAVTTNGRAESWTGRYDIARKRVEPGTTPTQLLTMLKG